MRYCRTHALSAVTIVQLLSVTTVARDFHYGYLWGLRTIRKLSRQTCARRSPTRDLWHGGATTREHFRRPQNDET